MNLKCCTFKEMADNIKKSNCKIVMFGVGSIGKTVAPEILNIYGISQHFDKFIDNDATKWGEMVFINGKEYEINSPNYLCKCEENTTVFINISRFADALEQLEKMKCTQNMSVYIIPMMCIHNWCSDTSKGVPIITDSPLIPKVIHYMWLGGKPIPENLAKCIKSWEKYCPDYEIIQWNENNYDISKHKYMKQAYDKKAFGFVPDYARLDILYEYGGFYMDTDVVLKMSLDAMRYQEAFVGVEKWQVVNFGGCSGAVKGHKMIKRVLDIRQDVYFLDESGRENRNPSGFYDTKAILDSGYIIDGTTQCIDGMNIYAYDYFHPYDYMSGILNETKNTRSIHYFNGGWLDARMKSQNDITRQNYMKLYKKALTIY